MLTKHYISQVKDGMQLLSMMLVLFIGLIPNVYSQCQELTPLEVINPGFEGPTAPHQTPAPWVTCGITPDTQPGSWGVTLPPSEGNSYVGFVYGSASWQEGAAQQLSGTLQAGVTYDFTIDLSATPASGGGINPNSFCSMEVWGGNSICVKQELLWSSPVITHYGWQTYDVSINASQNYPFIYFICNCGPLGYILLDNITPLVADNPNVFITSHVDGDAEACSFVLEGNVNDAIIDSVILSGNFQGSPLTANLVGLDWSAVLSFNGAGNETITATAYYTDQQLQEICVYTDVQVTVNAPTSAFNFTSECQDAAVSFVDASVPFGANTVTDWNWTFGDGNTSTLQNPTNTYLASGTYNVILEITTSDGCAVSSTQAVEIYEIPVADFTFNEACEGDITNFVDASSIGIGNIQSWQWDFADGNTSNIQNPTNTYTNLGVYPVELIVTTNNGCTNSIIQNVGMYPLPVADFGFNDACLNTAFQLEDLSTIVSGAITTWNWVLGDGNVSNVQNPVNTYAADGTYTISLTVTSDQSCTDAVSQDITVHPLPVSTFTNDTVCAELTMQFTDGSNVTSGSISGWQWYFGDGDVSMLQNPTHEYAIGGTYTASLVVTTALGCQDSSWLDVVVHPNPVSEFIPFSACFNEENGFTDQSSVIGSQVVAWDWDFGDNSGTSNLQHPTYTYGSSGQFTVELIVYTTEGCSHTSQHNVDVFDLPVADFTFTDKCEDDSVLFVDASSIPTGTITGWNWDFGNSTTSSLESPAHQVYAADGMYPVSLIVSSGFACSDTAEAVVEIFPVPIAEFTFDSVCFPLEIQFTDISDPNGAYDIDNWQWVFSDMQTSAIQSPSMNFGMPGTFSAELLVSNAPGCKSIYSAGDAVVHPLPIADFPSELATCLEDTIFFTDLSDVTPITNDAIDTWLWDFDDASTSALTNPYHVYGTHNLYNVQLTVTTNNQCSDDVTKMVEIYPPPEVDFVADPEEGCYPLRVQFLDESTIPAPYVLANWSWFLGADTLTAQVTNPYLIYQPELEPLDSAVYDIGVVVTSTNGCVSEVYRPEHVTVYSKPEALFSVKDDVLPVLDPKFQFTDLSTIDAAFWEWNFGDGQYATEQHPQHIYDEIGEYPIVLMIETDHGCRDTIDYKVTVEPIYTFYIPNSFTPDKNDHNETFYGQGEGYISYSMFVYDRWGEMIFQSEDDQYHWDGSYKGKQVQMGVYSYKFYIVDWENHEHEYKGHVTLFR